MKKKYFAWCKKDYLSTDILSGLLECVEDGTGDNENDRITAETSPIIYQDSNYIVTEDQDGYCYLLAIEEEIQEEIENNNFALDYIYNGLKSGKVYGHYMENVRFPSFYWNLCYDRIGNYFFWSNAGSSANKATKENLRWIIEGIFKTSPLAFLGKYMEKGRAPRN